jgi:hypothetical protein
MMWRRWFKRSAAVDTEDEVIECPCYRVCAALGLEMKRWCRYRKSDLPPVGLHRFNPKDEWCPTGVQANVVMLGHMLAQGGDSEALQSALARVRQSVQDLRARDTSAYRPEG